jgi:hypothetical protein
MINWVDFKSINAGGTGICAPSEFARLIWPTLIV